MSEQPRKRQSFFRWLIERPRRIFAGIILMQVLYVGSFGPACWLTSRREGRFDCPKVMAVWWPLGRAVRVIGDAVQRDHGAIVNRSLRITHGLAMWWITVGLPEGKSAIYRDGPSERDICVMEPPWRYF